LGGFLYIPGGAATGFLPSTGPENLSNLQDGLVPRTGARWNPHLDVNIRKIRTPWKINMEPTNQPFRKEHDLPNLHDYVPC